MNDESERFFARANRMHKWGWRFFWCMVPVLGVIILLCVAGLVGIGLLTYQDVKLHQ